MTIPANPFADDPTIKAQYSAATGWQATGRTYTTGDVSAVHTRLGGQLDHIRGRRGLSDEAKRIHIARAYKEARDSVTAMKQDHLDRINTERTKLHRKLFGHEGVADAQTVIVRRDAADRAAKLTKPEQAEHALRVAESNGDTHLAQAIAKHAAEQSWGAVVDTYMQSRPESAEAAQRLAALPDTNDGSWQLEQAMTYSVMQPSELGGMPDYSVDALAATELDVA
ncbi:hypothetical protein AN219_37720 [Streptomyces nanshensis]|nr:hypothetical protein AN219_37720 [Streptomyces nanshensis]